MKRCPNLLAGKNALFNRIPPDLQVKPEHLVVQECPNVADLGHEAGQSVVGCVYRPLSANPCHNFGMHRVLLRLLSSGINDNFKINFHGQPN